MTKPSEWLKSWFFPTTSKETESEIDSLNVKNIHYVSLVIGIVQTISLVVFLIMNHNRIVTIQNDKKLYTCTKEILKYRIAGMQMIEIQIGRMLCSPEALKTPLKNQVRQNVQPSTGRGIAKLR